VEEMAKKSELRKCQLNYSKQMELSNLQKSICSRVRHMNNKISLNKLKDYNRNCKSNERPKCGKVEVGGT